MAATFEIHPPSYPLSEDAFKHALTTGHGRALIHAQQFDVTEFRDAVFEAATTCLVYDPQVEGHREWWLAQLCQAAGLVERVIESPQDDCSRNREQWACLLKEFSSLGYTAALPRLYDLCRRTEHSTDVEACIELIEADGEKGLLFVAKQLGEALLFDPDFWVGDWELERFDELHGEGKAHKILAGAALSDPAIAHYLNEVAACKERQREDAVTHLPDVLEPVERVLQRIRSGTKPHFSLRRWGNRATLADLEQVAALLKAASPSSPTVLINVLLCLGSSGLPTFDESLLSHIFHAEDDVRFRAVQMFSHHAEPQVRRAGLECLNRGELEVGIELLRRSATSDDSQAILAALVRNNGKITDNSHGITSGLVHLMEANGAIREPLIPLYVYENSQCMMCRESAMKTLIQWGMCPEWLIEEAASDASESIRELTRSV